MLRKLYRLAFCVLKLTRYRFYASSLLFIYDGDGEVQDSYAEAHVGQYTEGVDPEAGPPMSDEAFAAKLTDRGLERDDFDLPDDGLGDHRHQHRRSQHHHSHSASARKRRMGHVTIRLIDFAHCTTGDDFNFSAPPPSSSPKDEDAPEVPVATFPPTHPDLPDTGFLLGVRSLCRALERIWEGERKRRAETEETNLPKLSALKIAHSDVFEDAFPGSIIEESRNHGYVGAFEPPSAPSSVIE